MKWVDAVQGGGRRGGRVRYRKVAVILQAAGVGRRGQKSVLAPSTARKALGVANWDKLKVDWRSVPSKGRGEGESGTTKG